MIGSNRPGGLQAGQESARAESTNSFADNAGRLDDPLGQQNLPRAQGWGESVHNDPVSLCQGRGVYSYPNIVLGWVEGQGPLAGPGLGQDVHCEPIIRDDMVMGENVHSSPSDVLGENVHSNPDTGQDENVHNNPCENVHNNPSENVHNNPCESVHNNPCENVHNNPCESVHNNPCESVHSNPCESVHNNPCENVHNSPCESVHNNPCESVHNNPYESVNNNPVTELCENVQHNTEAETENVRSNSDSELCTSISDTGRGDENVHCDHESADASSFGQERESDRSGEATNER